MADDHRDADLTPPLGHIADPVVDRALGRMWSRIEHDKRELHSQIEHVRKRTHELAEHQSRMLVEAFGLDGREGRVGRLEDTVTEIKSDAAAAKAASRGALFWIAGEAIVVVILFVSAFVAMKVALASLERDQEATDDKVERIERTTDKMDDRLDEALRAAPRVNNP